MVHPAGCLAADCRFLYLYDDEHTGRRFMGCLNKVYGVEIDVELFEQAERTRQGYGGVKMTGAPLPQCAFTVERAYNGDGQAFDCTNPRVFDGPVSGGEPDAAFDLRDHL